MDPETDAAGFVQSHLYVQVHCCFCREFWSCGALKRDRNLAQYNALLTRATTPGTNLYSPRWEGPPVPKLLEWGQLNALDLLNSGFAMLPKNRYAVFAPHESVLLTVKPRRS